MLPSKIGPHPEFPDNHIVMKAPPGSESWCGDLEVRIAQNAAGQIGFESEWLPTEDEKALIAAGAPIRTFICGTQLPPQSIWVREPDEI